MYALKILANTHAHIDTPQNTGFSRFGLLLASFSFLSFKCEELSPTLPKQKDAAFFT
jgi:hypothetical protein